MTITGELPAATKPDEKCRTCGEKGKLTSCGYCFDVAACTARREAKAKGTQNLRYPCLVKFQRLGATYYLREFGPKILPPPNPLPKGFTIDDYSDKGRTYFEAVMEIGSATSFSVKSALALAKMFNGTAVNK